MFSPRLCVVALAALVAGCVTTGTAPGVTELGEALRERTGATVRDIAGPAPPELPEGVDLNDGLSEDEAVAVALWNNPAFHADLASLGLARASLVEAGLLRNPVLSLLFPWGPKQLETTVGWPLEALWLRQRRVDIASLDAQAVGQALVQHGLDLVRDVRVAFAALNETRARAGLLADVSNAHEEILAITEHRLRVGDIGQQQVSSALATVLKARDAVSRVSHEATLAAHRLAALLGFGLEPLFDLETTTLEPAGPVPVVATADDALITMALAGRPDLRAAELAIESAALRAGLAPREALGVSGLIDANFEGSEGFEIGPGVDVPIPLFDRGQGRAALADAELEQTARRYAAVRNEIARQVRAARAEAARAEEALRWWRDEIAPALRETRDFTERAYDAGQVSYLTVLETQLELRAALAEIATLTAATHRALARVEHSLGQRIEP